MILYIVMLALYVTLTIFQMYAVVKQRHRNLLVFLFTISLVMHCLSFFFSTIHKVVFAQNGIGYKTLYVISDVIRIASLALFILFALIIAKGWPMTRSNISGKPLLLLACLVYIAIELILFVWIKVSQSYFCTLLLTSCLIDQFVFSLCVNCMSRMSNNSFTPFLHTTYTCLLQQKLMLKLKNLLILHSFSFTSHTCSLLTQLTLSCLFHLFTSRVLLELT